MGFPLFYPNPKSFQTLSFPVQTPKSLFVLVRIAKPPTKVF